MIDQFSTMLWERQTPKLESVENSLQFIGKVMFYDVTMRAKGLRPRKKLAVYTITQTSNDKLPYNVHGVVDDGVSETLIADGTAPSLEVAFAVAYTIHDGFILSMCEEYGTFDPSDKSEPVEKTK